MEQTLITGIAQAGAFAVLAYLVIRWQRDDLIGSRTDLKDLAEQAHQVQRETVLALQDVSKTLGELCGRIQAETPTTKP